MKYILFLLCALSSSLTAMEITSSQAFMQKWAQHFLSKQENIPIKPKQPSKKFKKLYKCPQCSKMYKYRACFQVHRSKCMAKRTQYSLSFIEENMFMESSPKTPSIQSNKELDTSISEKEQDTSTKQENEIKKLSIAFLLNK